ncbi:MAG: type I-G CRISPR-associated RAMP protein Csb1/Cas7g [Solirubrobacteraceae bacterium]
MIEPLEGEHRLVVDATLAPIATTTFQPTGFPDLGAAEFQRPGEPPSLLVESVQSLANHFEALGWDAANQRPIEPLAELPYVEVVDPGDERFLTSSRLEPHRLAAAYIREATIDGTTGTPWIADQFGLESGRPLDWRRIYSAVFALDPLCLIHGVFFSDQKWHGNPKVRRALAAVVEAHDVAPAVSGGLKRDDVSFKAGEGRGAAEGFGFVPFGRTEYVAREIRLRASVDLTQIRGYGLGKSETRLLTLLALWELAALLDRPLRLRTACDLDVGSVTVSRPNGFALPAASDLLAEIESTDVRFAEPGARRMRGRAGKGSTS